MSMRVLLSPLVAVALLTACQAPQAPAPVSPRLAEGFQGAEGAIAPAADEPVPGGFIVSLRPGADLKAFGAAAEAAGLVLRRTLRLGGRHLARVQAPEALDAAEAVRRLEALPGVQGAMADRRGTYYGAPDPRQGEQWAHRPDRADTEGAWGIVPVEAQRKTIAAVIDSGLDVDHPEFAGRVVAPRSFADPEASSAIVTDTVGHGTHVAGIVGAAGGNGVGVAGVAWGVGIMPIKTGLTIFDMLECIAYAVRYRPVPDDGSRVRVINMSVGFVTSGVNYLFAEAIEEARQAGCVVVISSGNNGADVINMPSSTPGAIAVGSTGESLGFWERLTTFSNHGPGLALTAPGENILSAAPGGGYVFMSGTSMAAPYAAGVAALIAARYDPENARMDAAFADLVRQRLLSAVDDLGTPGPDPYYGSGRLNARKAVTPATLEEVL
ncbi:MAG: S8 family peptidase [Candidatus Sericytochromatia bacterium]